MISNNSKKSQSSRNLISASIAALAMVSMAALSGCGTETATASGTTLSSQAFNTSVASFKLLDWLIPSAVAVAPSISSFKFCVTQLKLEASDGSAIKHNGSDLLEAKLGLIDLDDGTQSVSWGNLTIPEGTAIKRIKIEVHKDAETCAGASYSASINGQTISKDLEFVFKFANPKPLAAGESVSVALTNLVTKLTEAATAGTLNDEQISHYLDGTVEDDAN